MDEQSCPLCKCDYLCMNITSCWLSIISVSTSGAPGLFSLNSNDCKAWINNHIHKQLQLVFIHPCHNISGSLHKRKYTSSAKSNGRFFSDRKINTMPSSNLYDFVWVHKMLHKYRQLDFHTISRNWSPTCTVYIHQNICKLNGCIHITFGSKNDN